MEKIQRQEPIAKAIWWSCMVHVGLLALFLIKEAVLPSTPKLIPPSLRVDLVGLPDIVKKDLRHVKPAAVAKEEPKPSAAEPEAAPEPDEMVLNTRDKKKEKDKRKKEEAAERAEDKAREKKINSALARIRSLEKLKDEAAEDAEESVVIKGNQVSRGTSLSGDAKESLEATYYDLVRESLSANWSIPAWLSRQRYSAQVQITIDSQGNLTGTRFIRHSGNDQFDAEVRNTLKASQFPPPPKDLAGDVAKRGILVGFPL